MPKQRRFHSHKAAKLTTIRRRVGFRNMGRDSMGRFVISGPTKRPKRIGRARSELRSWRRR